MKKKVWILVHFPLFHLLLWMNIILCADSQQDPLECTDVTYLEVGKEGMINCNFDSFFAVSWYTKEDFDEENPPLIYFNGDKDGLVDQYNVHPNGSFVFRNLSIHDAGSYTVTLLKELRGNLLVRDVHLRVYVIPDPKYPVVEGYISQQHVYMDVGRNGELSCSVRRVYPNISLVWTVIDRSQVGKIHFHQDVVGRRINNDGTYDITLTSLYDVTDQSVRRITIQCGVADEVGEVLASKTKVDLLFSSVYPVVNGHTNQKHVYLDAKREGHLICIKENVAAGTTLAWKIVDPNMQEKITFQSNTIVLENNDGTVTINQTFDYEILDHSLDRINIECEVTFLNSDENSLTTKVDLLFPNVEPGLEVKVNYVLALVVLLNFLLICPVIIFVVACMGRRRMCKEKVKIFIRSNSNVMETPVSQDIEQGAANGKPETISLLSTSQNTAGPISSDSGKGSGSDSGSDENDKAHFSDGGKLIVAAEDNGEIRRAENHNLTKTILRTFQLLFDKYLSREHEIEETVALINEEEKQEEKLD